jgi:ERCC4-type nuclease
MIIKIDYREKDLEKNIINIKNNNKKYENIQIKIVNLHLGDIILCDNNDKEIIIIERKTLKDLASSICDGRYKDQSKRLDSYNIHNHNIYYLIEGNISNFKPFTRTRNIITSDILLSSFTSISNIKGFSIYKSENVNESARWILQMMYKINKEKYNSYFNNNLISDNNSLLNNNTNDNTNDNTNSNTNGNTNDNINNFILDSSNNNNNNNNSSNNYIPIINKKKSDNITVENIDIIILSQIPKVSVMTATSIINEYKTLCNLIDVMRNDKEALSNIKTFNNNKYRKISKTSIENIYKFLLKNV